MKVLIKVLLLALAQNAFAYPITPVSLRNLVIESEYIVYADVVDIKHIEPNNHWSDAKAILVIRELLQGQLASDSFEVYFSPGMICPAPAHYEKGTAVLAFLNRSKTGFFTNGLSYGSKTLDEVDFQIYKRRIVEMQDIVQIENEEKKLTKTFDWLISCIENPATRWEGMYEFSTASDFLYNYDPEEDTLIRKHELNENQELRLRNIFFSMDDWDYLNIELIDLIAKPNDEQLLGFLIRKLKQHEAEGTWYKSHLIVKIAELSGNDELKKIAVQIREIDYFDANKEEKENQLAREFMKKI